MPNVDLCAYAGCLKVQGKSITSPERSKEAKKLESRMEVPSPKRHSVFVPFGFALITFRWHRSGSGFVRAWRSVPMVSRKLAEKELRAK